LVEEGAEVGVGGVGHGGPSLSVPLCVSLLRRAFRSGRLEPRSALKLAPRKRDRVMAAASSYLSSTQLRPRRGAGFRALRALVVLLVILGVIGLTAGLWLHGRLASSLPQLDGERGVAGLAAPVEIERDDLGVPTIHAANRLDGARAL